MPRKPRNNGRNKDESTKLVAGKAKAKVVGDVRRVTDTKEVTTKLSDGTVMRTLTPVTKEKEAEE